MRIRSEFDPPERDLRLLRLADTSATEPYVEAHSVVRTHPISGATSTILVYEMDGDLYRTVPFPSPEAAVTDEGRSLVPFIPSEHEDVRDDYGARWAKHAHPNVTA